MSRLKRCNRESHKVINAKLFLQLFLLPMNKFFLSFQCVLQPQRQKWTVVQRARPRKTTVSPFAYFLRFIFQHLSSFSMFFYYFYLQYLCKMRFQGRTTSYKMVSFLTRRKWSLLRKRVQTLCSTSECSSISSDPREIDILLF